jgi:hypothetical protein
MAPLLPLAYPKLWRSLMLELPETPVRPSVNMCRNPDILGAVIIASHSMKILLQTTIPAAADDWSVARFSQLAACMRRIGDKEGDRQLFQVTTRDRSALGAPDPILSTLDRQPFDELWLLAVDVGSGLTPEDCDGISRFWLNGGGLLVARDHMDLGSSVCGLGAIGRAHHFHSKNLDPDESMQRIDDPYSKLILWPNFHSGSNGDYQEIRAAEVIHPVFVHPTSPTGALRYLPAHPHEGSVSAPPHENARVIGTGTSKITGRQFNIAVAFEPTRGRGAALAASTFHHFADYNWDPSAGAPTFVDEPAGSSMLQNPEAIEHTHRYVENIARWLAPGRI